MRTKFSPFFLALGFCALLSISAARAEAVVGQPAPALTAATMDGKNFDLSTLKGKVVIIHFWATWCAPCREEMPALEAVWRQYHGQGLEVLAVNANRPREKSDVAQVMHYFTFPGATLNALTKNDFGTPNSIPITYVINKEGNVENVMTPDTQPLSEKALGDEVKKALEAKPEAKADVKPEVKPDSKPDSSSETKTDPKP
jgi:cytochrome c biogenesis protein CcmG, thiol:disulfide interchange protein DsbE